MYFIAPFSVDFMWVLTVAVTSLFDGYFSAEFICWLLLLFVIVIIIQLRLSYNMILFLSANSLTINCFWGSTITGLSIFFLYKIRALALYV